MTVLDIPNAWKLYFEDRGLNPESIEVYVSYVAELSGRGLPVIFELEHLSQLVGIKIDEVTKMIFAPHKFYRRFTIPKRSGGVREISSPYPSLLKCQHWIYSNILLRQEVHECAHGFIPGRSILSNAIPHLNKKVVLKMDIKNFFPSIPINWVVNLFSSMGYANNVSFFLASLCCLEGVLSQGAATSPYLSNILLLSLDKRLKALASSYGLQYTRYADDMTFSGGYIPHSFVAVVEGVVESYGLYPNKNKTRLIIEAGQRIVTGVSVANEKPALPRSTKREIKSEFHFIRKYGLLSHISKQKIKDPYYLDVVQGKLAFWLQIEPDDKFAKDAFAYIKRLNKE